MNKILSLLLCAAMFSCDTAKSARQSATRPLAVQSGCPEDGVCTIAKYQNKSIVVTEGERGSLSYQLQDAPSTDVYVLTYTRNVPEGVQDGTYREEIIFESVHTNTATVMEGAALQNAKLLFGRFCYCKGQTGYYRIDKGTLRVSGSTKQRQFSLDFRISETPQILSAIRFSDQS
ncbi:hypothetical protein HYN48_04970 [Flavobacterium magnum]|uniref:Lipoprotein n=1 Tax=Flavobacterium magnum TaxID=2162713 RepID=A0A2S0REF8_9FLAO|nr:hypothetical protein [Flavobacterium magnum]AWA29491.1 hypothetical protein HYN48_04970 [Flavobacterium magnum]